MRRTSTVYAIAIAAMVAIVGLTACAAQSGSNSGSSSAGGKTITLQNIAFDPSSNSVKVGTTVTFKNADQVTHHIVVGTDDLGEQQPGATKTWKASKDGTYVMKCLIHPSMQGRITVGSGGSTIGTAPAGGSGGGAGY